MMKKLARILSAAVRLAIGTGMNQNCSINFNLQFTDTAKAAPFKIGIFQAV